MAGFFFGILKLVIAGETAIKISGYRGMGNSIKIINKSGEKKTFFMNESSRVLRNG